MTMAGNKKLLLVDDNHDILDLLEVFLYDDFEITSVLNGFEGLKTAEEVLPDLIITDIMMPVMDGIKFLNNLRKKPKIAQVPVIAITSFAKKLNVKSLLNMGFSGVVSKPFNREAILEVIADVLNKK
jgi:Response regulator containing CheY-like receiver, AAA-type ATPase, and DNA-binding domains